MAYTSPTPAFFAPLRGMKEEWVIGAEEDTMTYVEHMVKIMEKVKRVLKPDGSLWLNMADYSRMTGGALVQIPEMTSLTLQQHGWHLMSTLIWHRFDQEIPKRRFIRDWEYLYWFTKSKDYYFNEDCGNDIRGRAIIDIPYVLPKDSFMSGYPEELVDIAIRATTPKNGTVLDPLMGSGVTGISALKNGCYFIGIDISPHVVNEVGKRLSNFG
jgi:DNA modification methylase